MITRRDIRVPEIADIQDALRAAYWRIRSFVLRCRFRLTGKGYFESLQEDPRSPGFLFGRVVLSVSLLMGDEPSLSVVVTPRNVLEYTVPRVDATILVPAQTDAVEAWRLLRKRLRQEGGRTTLTVCNRCRHELRIDVTADGTDRICFNLKRGLAIQHPEHVEAELGIEPGKVMEMTAENLTRLLTSMLAHSRDSSRRQDSQD